MLGYQAWARRYRGGPITPGVLVGWRIVREEVAVGQQYLQGGYVILM